MIVPPTVSSDVPRSLLVKCANYVLSSDGIRYEPYYSHIYYMTTEATETARNRDVYDVEAHSYETMGVYEMFLTT